MAGPAFEIAANIAHTTVFSIAPELRRFLVALAHFD
jgi:hypothetical protein